MSIEQVNPWLEAIKAGAPFTVGITCTGRRVVAKVFDYATEKAVLAVQKSEDASGLTDLYQHIVQRHVFQGEDLNTARPFNDYKTSVLSIEEMDMIMLARAASHGTKVDFAYSCQACGEQTDLRTDLKWMKRYMVECADPQCYCHSVNAAVDNIEDVEAEEYDSFKFMSEEWSKVQEDHLLTAPPERSIVLPYLDGCTIYYRLTRAETNARFANLALNQDDKLIQKFLEYSVQRIHWPLHNIDATTKVDISYVLSQWPNPIRIDVMVAIQRVKGGTDNSVLIKCSNPRCRRKAKATVPFGPLFLYPPKGTT